MVMRSFSSSRNGKRLTGKATRDDVAGKSGNVSYVSIVRHAWPVFAEDGTGVGVDLGEADGFEAGTFKAKAKSSDSAEEVKDCWFIHQGC